MQVVLYGTPPQREMVLCDAPVQIWICGRRWGKTFTARNKILKAALRLPRRKTLYCALTYSLCREQYDEMIEHEGLRQLIRRGTGGRLRCGLQPYPRIMLVNGSEI